ncbi:hypothetical protein F7725_009375 [Dissostichus mawsoni]|uniref:Uncharacterized protein n=1 Tax=Dissostichus mawsoni TaxID=36200 RepID=A0A7J5Z784_DISMA|nr:hypothetical protein F7725_009375 [Dissostichus mawsoni]
MGMSHSGEQWKEFLAVVEGVEGVQYRDIWKPFSNNKLIRVLKNPVPTAQGRGGGGLCSRLQQPDANRNSLAPLPVSCHCSPPHPHPPATRHMLLPGSGKGGMLKRPTSLMRRGLCKNVGVSEVGLEGPQEGKE